MYADVGTLGWEDGRRRRGQSWAYHLDPNRNPLLNRKRVSARGVHTCQQIPRYLSRRVKRKGSEAIYAPITVIRPSATDIYG